MKQTGIFLSLCLVLFFISTDAQEINHEFVYQEAPFPECHASTIVEVQGTLIAAWFGGTHEKHDDVGIWISRKIDGTWSDPVEVVNGVQEDGGRYPCWNPVLAVSPQNEVYLFYKVGPNPREWWGELITSDDRGATWKNQERLPDGILGPVKNKAELLDNGTLLCPSSTEHDGWTVHVELTPDWGKTWERVGPLPAEDNIQAIQPTVLIHEDRLQMLCRSKKSGIVETWSTDNGKSWTPLKKTTLPNPNSGIDGVTTKSGMHYLVYNPTSTPEGEWGGERYPLVLASSRDGVNWVHVSTLESEPGEYSYPAIIEGADGVLHITYTWKRDKIKHVTVNP